MKGFEHVETPKAGFLNMVTRIVRIKLVRTTTPWPLPMLAALRGFSMPLASSLSWLRVGADLGVPVAPVQS